MRGVTKWRGSKRLTEHHVRRVAVCTSVRHDARVAAIELNTGDYPMDDRVRLGRDVTRTREASGWGNRQEFATFAGVSLRSLAKLESPIGEKPVGRKVLEAIARALPNWTEDTPRTILEGGEAPPIPQHGQAPEPPPSGRKRPEPGSREWWKFYWDNLPEEMFYELRSEFARLERQRRTEREDSDTP